MAEAKVLNVAVVSAERALWSGQAKSIVAKTPEGDIGILANHEPVLALLVDSSGLKIEELDGSTLMVAVHGGFFSVSGNEVNVIAEVAELAEDIDVERAREALARLQAESSSDESEQAALKRAETRIQVAGIVKTVSSR
ncbi:MAG: F0F1 ATP synthase subunit epsilon [Candidatus Nanopelagicales bacterium]|jgi:F-type H+-transporting ATPase subunit epsilon|nr:F0F1 ATP synthase subunit epsilon [Candidatus Nanopelagicales bacterium]MCF8537996.1 F0F1 ATP synthase subunit epsilon [Candidatus Nanopelagicales bacterium]MCF8542842.1 F0F1 ATP synthase subunit epsilon [Candidatus Nanopelagicales bacterium]MCF8557027.1 F0F1 ATP synthase subunit epsilon [Candidatus Nanopelagicales bacterium]